MGWLKTFTTIATAAFILALTLNVAAQSAEQGDAYTATSGQGAPVAIIGKAAPGDKAASPEIIRRDIKRILERPDFRFTAENKARPLPKWVQWIKDAWNRFWENIVKGGARLAENTPWLPYAAVAIAGAALLIMTWRIISESVFEGKSERAGQAQSATATPAKLFAAAAAAYDNGDIRRAIRLLFSAALLSLFGEAARTTPTYLLAAKLAHDDNAPTNDFLQLKRSFEETYYGSAPAVREEYENARRITLKLRRINEEVKDEQ